VCVFGILKLNIIL